MDLYWLSKMEPLVGGGNGEIVPLRASFYTLAECPNQTRRRMKRSKKAQELLQSSDQANSEHRVWRETIKEKLQMDSQERRQGQEQIIKFMEDQIEMLRSLIEL
ncbi:unnamed protein product [Caretta caretta]